MSGHAPGTALHSCLYEGTVHHRRHWPRPSGFRYGITYLYLDLAELDRLESISPWFGIRRRRFIRWRRRDYLPGPEPDLCAEVRARVEQALGRRPNGPVRLLCLPAMAGHCFNPVTFHYCFAEQGEALEALVVEITNTPWRERRVYVFDARAAGAEGTLDVRLPKDFHISPFLDQDLDFHWQFQAPGRRLLVQMEDLQRGAGPGRPPVGTRLFDSTLSAERVPLSPANLRRFALRRALPGLRVLGAIHWQAALLWLRRTPFCIHPAKRAKTLGDAAGPGAPP